MSVTTETLDLMKQAQSKASDDILKAATVNIASGLVAYDLQAPAKQLYPTITILRNRIPRVGGGTGTATNWRQVSSIVGSGYNASPWVPEGQRAAAMSLVTANKAAAYVTLGEEADVTFEAESAGRTFEDVRATAAIRLLQKMMLKEEDALLGGNTSLTIAKPTAPTVSASNDGAINDGTYNVKVVALSYEGYRNSSLTGGVATSMSITGKDSLTFTLNGGSSDISNATSTGALSTSNANSISASTPVVNGAAGYAWYVGTSGSEKLEAITTINSVKLLTLAGTHQAASLVSGDHSSNSLAFDGLLTTAYANSSLAYIASLATGTAGTGTPLTASDRGSVKEIDTMFKAMWDNYRLSPSLLLVSSQELLNITSKVLNASSGPLLRINEGATGGAGYSLTASGTIEFYFNPYSVTGGYKIPIMLHPTLPPGTILGWCENLPAQYQNSNVPNVAEVRERRGYYELQWPLRTRAYEHGVTLH